MKDQDVSARGSPGPEQGRTDGFGRVTMADG